MNRFVCPLSVLCPSFCASFCESFWEFFGGPLASPFLSPLYIFVVPFLRPFVPRPQPPYHPQGGLIGEELYTFAKMNHVSIKMILLDFMESFVMS